MYYIKFHHEQDLPIGYFDDETHTYHTIGDAEFQRRGIELIQKMLQTGFVSFLQRHSNSLISRHLDDILRRNLPRMGDKNLSDIAVSLAHVLSQRK